MTPPVAIALIAKLKLIFETDADGKPQPDKFLAFQNGAFPVSEENFYFMDPDKYKLGAIDTVLKMVDFANTFNFIAIPDDLITLSSDELDEVYHQILKTAKGADSTRTAEEEKKYTEAKDYLNQIMETSDGQHITLMANYDHYDNLYKEALSKYKSERLKAQNASGEDAAAIKEAWTEAEPELKKAMESALFNWQTLGKRDEVERYLGIFLTLTAGSPIKTIADLKQEYELFVKSNALDHLANELHYIPTYFTPLNFFEADVAWQSMSLDKSEVSKLVQQAPQRLKDLFDMDDSSVDIDQISFEYMVVQIVREWFHYADFLLQHFWKQTTDKQIISDGNGKGSLPSFPEKMIFVRNVKIKSAAGGSKTVSDHDWKLTANMFMKLKPDIRSQSVQKSQILEHRRGELKILKTALQKDSVISTKKVSEIKPTWFTRAAPKTVSDLRVEKKFQPVMLRGVLKQPVKKAGIDIHRIDVLTMPTSTPDSSITEIKNMELLGFICRRVPLCPDPDQHLTWSD